MASQPIILSSSPLPVVVQGPAVSNCTAQCLQLSSSPLPSPRALIQKLATQEEIDSSLRLKTSAAAATDVWEVHHDDDDDSAALPRPKKVSRASGKAGAAGGKQKKQSEKATKHSNSTTVDKSKNVVATGISSMYFGTDKTNEAATITSAKVVKSLKKQPTKPRKSSRKPILKDISEPPLANGSHQSLTAEKPQCEPIASSELETTCGETVYKLPARRRQWTPPQDTVIELDPSSSPVGHNTRGRYEKPNFSGMVDSMRYSLEPSEETKRTRGVSIEGREVQSGPLRKRSISMVHVPSGFYKPGVPQQCELQKTKKTKKAQTLTDLSASKYRKVTKSPGSSITDYFSSQGKPQTSRASRSVKTRAPIKSGKAKEPSAPLLSPTSAKARFEQQEFVFGTSSQLSLDNDLSESDTDSVGLRISSLHAPSSKSVDATTTASSTIMQSSYASPERVARSASRATNEKGLWTAAARDLDGGLMEVEVVDTNRPCDPLEDVDNAVNTPVYTTVQENSEEECNEIETETDIPNVDSQQVTQKALAPSGVEPEMPDFRAYPTTRLQAELSRFGFKNIKNRAIMVARLEKCWVAQHKSVRASQLANVDVATDTEISANKGYMRLTGNHSQPNHPEAEPITMQEASDIPAAEGGPRKFKKPKSTEERSETMTGGRQKSEPLGNGSKRKKTSKYLPLGAEAMAVVQKKISMAVRRAGSASETSFHLRLLMYDPIILEDLTAWINTHGKEIAGIEEDVCDQDVKAWCEANGVCCLTKESQRGLGRKRF